MNSFDYDIDFALANLDTIQLQALPFISYNQMKAYNAETYTTILTVALSQLSGYQPNANGHMFVLTVDGKRMYCGFIQPLLSSAYLQWIVVNEPLEVEGKDRNFKIHFNLPAPDEDPRNKSEIIERFRKDRKLAR